MQLQAALQRPHDGDDKNRERERRKHTRGPISREGNGQADYETDRHSQFETLSHMMPP